MGEILTPAGGIFAGADFNDSEVKHYHFFTGARFSGGDITSPRARNASTMLGKQRLPILPFS